MSNYKIVLSHKCIYHKTEDEGKNALKEGGAISEGGKFIEDDNKIMINTMYDVILRQQHWNKYIHFNAL